MANHSIIVSSRESDAQSILETLALGQSIAVTGLSNFGKSTLLRYMSDAPVAEVYARIAGRPGLLVYVDCNGMLEMSTQGFYEVILRAVVEALLERGRQALAERIRAQYGKVVEARSAFAIPLAFNDTIVSLMGDTDIQDVILMLDEFDDVLTGLDERVFLNLRALKDKYGERLNYVIAMLRPPSTVGGGDDMAEFLEMFGIHKYHLQPLSADNATELAATIFSQNNDSLDPHERDYILALAGGHPGLIEAVAYVVMQVESGAPETYTAQALNMAGDMLENHRLVRTELHKLWKHLLPEERELAAIAATRGVEALTPPQQASLVQRGLLVEQEGERRFFAQLFAHYARRQGIVQKGVPGGVWIDVDAGRVWVEGRAIESLTDLEYRLLLLLYGRLDKICDKYQIVDAVWGQDYLGEVDDARIEKLVSRLRAKLEPDPANPQHIVTIRGRGYKLTSAS